MVRYPSQRTASRGNRPKRDAYCTQESYWNRAILNPLTLNVEPQDLEFALLGFSLAFGQYFLTMYLVLSFGLVRYIQCYVGRMGSALFIIGYNENWFESQMRLWTFK